MNCKANPTEQTFYKIIVNVKMSPKYVWVEIRLIKSNFWIIPAHKLD